MGRLIVSAAGSPLFGNMLMVVSVSAAVDGTPTKGLKAQNFKIADLASLNHASAHVREIDKVSEGPDGFYTISLKPWEPQPHYPPGHYVLSVSVAIRKAPEAEYGQAVAVGDILD